MVPQVQQLGLPWTRIPAVDGQALSKETLHTLTDLRSFRRNMGRFPRTGTLGCSLSHINVWKAFLASPYQYALILEDDVVFDPKELCKVIDDLKKRAQDWDLCTFEIHHRGFPLKLSALPSGRKLATYLFPVTHSGGYLINRKAARMLFEKSLPLVLPLDHFFTRTWEMPFKFRGLEPRLMHQQGEAVISRTSETSAEKWDRFFWRLQHAIFVAKTALIWFFNRLIL
jgi:glycosyl transferase family 25